ncbi:MAG: SDR family oxidoreductase [Pseudomonadota bacterium]|nr:SDR family oxidoreductase [Pseudomonadota bacterium]
MNKRVLVCGGAGFLGSNLCERLLRDGHEVLCLDNFTTSDARNIHHLSGHPRFKFLYHDILKPVEAEADDIYNLACPASPIHYQADPIRTIITSVRGAYNVLKLAHRSEARAFQASTSEVYGDPAVHPQRENYWGHVNPVGPRACYDEGKRCAEALFLDYRRQCGLRVKVGRIFNTYGPRMQVNDGRVVSNFIVQALRNRPLSIYGDGSQTRSFCYVDDLIEGMLRFMDTNDELSGPLNLGNPAEITVSELAARIIDLTASKSRLVYHPLPHDDPTRRCPDITLAKRYLGWLPAVSLNEGLKKTIAYFDRMLAAPAASPMIDFNSQRSNVAATSKS